MIDRNAHFPAAVLVCLLFFGEVLIFGLIFGCGEGRGDSTIESRVDVEVAPGKWLELSIVDTAPSFELENSKENPHQLSAEDALRQIAEEETGLSEPRASDEMTSLSFEWNRRKVKWVGKEIPISLREQEGDLFLIGFNREDRAKKRFAFFRLDPAGTGFEQIDAREFPRRIATQNMWLDADRRFFRVGETMVDEWEMLRDLDINCPYFDHSLTAYIWYQLETGIEMYEMPRLIDETFLEQYVENYDPIPLLTIVKD